MIEKHLKEVARKGDLTDTHSINTRNRRS